MKNNQKQCKVAIKLYVTYAWKMIVLLNTSVKKNRVASFSLKCLY